MTTNGKKLVLIADDDIDSLNLLSMHVKNMGFDVLTAEDQKTAEEYIENTQPDLAIFDLMMDKPDSGFILSYKLKKKFPDVPVIIATAVTAETGMVFGLGTPEEKKWIKADVYLDKGIRPDQLHVQINKLLKI